MYLSESLQKKWEGVLDHPDLPKIEDKYKKAVTAVVLENQATEMAKSGQVLSEAVPTNSASQGDAGIAGFGGSASSPVAGFDPILISLVRRSLPNLIAYDICGVQPMTGPTGLIFAMRSKFDSQDGTEAFYNEANTGFAGEDGAQTALAAGGAVPTEVFTSNAAPKKAMTTSKAESLGDGNAANTFHEMAFSIEKVTVTARTRALKAEYSMELAQDLKAVHGLDAETELSNILSAEILAEINREVIRTIYQTAVQGAQVGTTTRGKFDLDTDSNGRWMVEKFKGLMFQIEREANSIAKGTRRGKGNMIICSSDVASALQMAGVLDYAPALNSNNLSVDDTGNTFAGVLNGRIRVYIDPYTTGNYMTVGYKGSSAFDAGLFYCPYVPLQMVRAVGEDTFQPKIGFKTRYGVIENPFARGTTALAATGALGADSNEYYRKIVVDNIM